MLFKFLLLMISMHLWEPRYHMSASDYNTFHRYVVQITYVKLTALSVFKILYPQTFAQAKLGDTGYTDWLNNLGFESLDIRRLSWDLCIVFKIINEINLKIEDFFELSNAANNRGQRQNFSTHSFSEGIVTASNSLPLEIKNRPLLFAINSKVLKGFWSLWYI